MINIGTKMSHTLGVSSLNNIIVLACICPYAEQRLRLKMRKLHTTYCALNSIWNAGVVTYGNCDTYYYYYYCYFCYFWYNASRKDFRFIDFLMVFPVA